MPVTLGVRPEAIGVSLEGEGDAQVTVRNFEQLGSVTYIYTAFPNGETLTVQLPRQIPLRRGQTIGVTFDPASFLTERGTLYLLGTFEAPGSRAALPTVEVAGDRVTLHYASPEVVDAWRGRALRELDLAVQVRHTPGEEVPG